MIVEHHQGHVAGARFVHRQLRGVAQRHADRARRAPLRQRQDHADAHRPRAEGLADAGAPPPAAETAPASSAPRPRCRWPKFGSPLGPHPARANAAQPRKTRPAGLAARRPKRDIAAKADIRTPRSATPDDNVADKPSIAISLLRVELWHFKPRMVNGFSSGGETASQDSARAAIGKAPSAMDDSIRLRRRR